MNIFEEGVIRLKLNTLSTKLKKLYSFIFHKMFYSFNIIYIFFFIDTFP